MSCKQMLMCVTQHIVGYVLSDIAQSLDKAILAGTDWQAQRRAEVEAHMKKKLAKKPWIADQSV